MECQTWLSEAANWAKQKYAPQIHELTVKALKAVTELIEYHEAAKADADDNCLLESDEFPLILIINPINIVMENTGEEIQNTKMIHNNAFLLNIIVCKVGANGAMLELPFNHNFNRKWTQFLSYLFAPWVYVDYLSASSKDAFTNSLQAFACTSIELVSNSRAKCKLRGTTRGPGSNPWACRWLRPWLGHGHPQVLYRKTEMLR